jgi:Zn-dependent M28 family amino/carboxypeptidase
LSGARIIADVAHLAGPELHGRGSGTADEKKAGEWIAAELDRLKLPAYGARITPFEHASISSANISAVILPSSMTTLAKGPIVVIGAHYDHLGVVGGQTFYGAEDNASGVATLLAITRALTERRAELKQPVVVVFFGAEERGLFGSIEWVKAWKSDEHRITTMINVDMIGRPLVDQPGLWLAAKMAGVLSDVDPTKAVGVLVRDGDTVMTPRARAACDAEGIKAVTIADLPPSIRATVEGQTRDRGDFAPFDHRGVPYAFFSSGESSDYHAATDTVDKLEPTILEARARAILRFVVASSTAP